MLPSKVAILAWAGAEEAGRSIGSVAGFFPRTSLPPWYSLGSPFQPDSMALFVFQSPADHGRRLDGRVVRFREGRLQDFKALLEQQTTQLDETASTHKEGQPGQRTVAGLRMYGSGRGWLAAFPDPQTMLCGSDGEALAVMIAVYRAGRGTPLGPELARALTPLQRDTVFGVSVRSDDAPGDASEVSFGVRFAQGLAAELEARYETRAAAEAQRQRAADYLEELAKHGDAAARARLNAVKLSAKDGVFRAELHLDGEQCRQWETEIEAHESHERMEQAEWTGRGRLRDLSVAIHLYLSKSHGTYPPDLQSLVEEGLVKDEGVDITWPVEPPLTEGKKTLEESYRFIGSLPAEPPPEVIVLYARRGIYPDRRNVVTADVLAVSRTEAESHDPTGSPRAFLVASYKVLTERLGARLSSEDLARLRSFYETGSAAKAEQE